MASDEGRLALDLETMNETDVREIIVRPLLHRLGYSHGSDANIRTEVALRYGRAFLGRKNPSKDPDLIGRADYICEVISYGRWAVEVKAPNQPLDRDAVEQAHTYAAHPEIGAAFFLLTNGCQFELYQTGMLDKPVFASSFQDLEENMLRLFNVVGPDAIKKRSNLIKVDAAKPLGRGLASRLEIIGGEVTYEEHQSNTPLVPNEAINGLKLPVTGGMVQRLDDGRLHGRVMVANPAPMLGDYKSVFGVPDDYDFYSADEYISGDPDSPTIFQNLVNIITPAGKQIYMPGYGQVALPFGFILKAYTEAVGFVENNVFRGTMRLEYDLTVTGLTPQVRMLLERQMGQIPDRSEFGGVGRFEVRFT